MAAATAAASTVVLIYEDYENEFGFVERDDLSDPIVPCTVERKKDRHLRIFTWGLRKHDAPACQIHFDVSKFYTHVDPSVDVRQLTGLDTEIQEAIVRHPRFGDLVVRIVATVEENDLSSISFACAHGKHRSVGWAEIIKTHYYPRATTYHASDV